MALTAPQIIEIKEILLGDHNSVSDDGLIIQVEKASGGDSQKRKAARARALIALL